MVLILCNITISHPAASVAVVSSLLGLITYVKVLAWTASEILQHQIYHSLVRASSCCYQLLGLIGRLQYLLGH